LPAETAQIVAQAEEAPGIEADDDQVSVRPQDALHLAQAGVGMLLELQGVEGNQHIHAVALQRQFISVAAQGDAAELVAGGIDAVVDRAVVDQAARREGPRSA
jgi:hypothetical protein